MNRISTSLALAVFTTAIATTTVAGAGDSCNSKAGKWKQTGGDTTRTAFVPGATSHHAAFIKTGHHMEKEKHGGDHHGIKMESNADIVDTAVSTGTFDTLVTAVKAAGLVETLKSDGPFTVFAPTDEAFAKLPKEKLDALLKDKAALKKILTYHVVSGKVTSSDVVKLKSAKTVEGQSINISTNNGVRINDAKVIMTDIITTNGVIHVVDTVILPPDMMASL